MIPAFRLHRCVSLLPLPEPACNRLTQFFTLQSGDSDALPADTAALIAATHMLDRLAAQPLPKTLHCVTVVGCDSVSQVFLERIKHREILVTWPGVGDADTDAAAMEVCHDVMAAFGFGRMGARPRNVINDDLLCNCC